MEEKYGYFRRDISWLSFNYRVLLEAECSALPIYERIRFLSIYSSNLEEFYEIRVAEHRGIIMRKDARQEIVEEAEATLQAITREVNRQQREYYRIFSDKIIPELNRNNIYLYGHSHPEPFHKAFVRNFFNEEVFPFLSPVMIRPGDIRTFIRDRRLYLVVRMKIKGDKPEEDLPFHYALIKIPHAKVPRFIELPRHEGRFYLMFIDDMIRANLSDIFPGYDIDGCFGIKISRDADIILENERGRNIIEDIRRKVKQRKTGALSRFMYDRDMPDNFLSFLCSAFGITSEDLVMGGRYLNLQDLALLPNPKGKELEEQPLLPMRVTFLDRAKSMFKAISKRDVLLHFPYQSFDYLIRFLMEAAFDPKVQQIKITQYRVAENSAVINALLSAARSGKKVTVFVELKARFDEENNMTAAEKMEQAGIKIIYSLPGFKVHAKVAVVIRKNNDAHLPEKHFAYLSTGNFNEKTARCYADMALLTTNKEMVQDIITVFNVLEGAKTDTNFFHLLLAPFNMVDQLTRMISREMENARTGRKARIILKMNGLHDRNMIDQLYKASQCGVDISLIVRGICCLVPNQPYSQNIRVIRIVDTFLEHARIWYFYNDGKEDVYLSSADWMQRNLSRRIETAFPILDPILKQEVIDLLEIQLNDNVKACRIDDQLTNIFPQENHPDGIRSQHATYKYLQKNNERYSGQDETL